MAFCPSCGREVDEAWRFCRACGEPLTAKSLGQEPRPDMPPVPDRFRQELPPPRRSRRTALVVAAAGMALVIVAGSATVWALRSHAN